MAGNSFLHVTDLNYQKCIFFLFSFCNRNTNGQNANLAISMQSVIFILLTKSIFIHHELLICPDYFAWKQYFVCIQTWDCLNSYTTAFHEQGGNDKNNRLIE